METKEKIKINKDDITSVFCESLNKKGRKQVREATLIGMIGATAFASYTALANPHTYDSAENALAAVGIGVLSIGLTTLAMYITASAVRPVYQWFLYDNHVKEKTLEYIATTNTK